jgi:3-(3-hydroxy-phenyl)propionate hydroxylase
MYNLQQQYIEQYLWDAVEKCELIDARWRAEVTGVGMDDRGAKLDVASPDGAYVLHCDYILAADGARSPVRKMLGLRLHGDSYEGRYVIADVRMAHDFPTERRALFEPASNPGGTVLIHRQPDNIWRIDYQLRAGESEEDALRESSIRSKVQAILEEIGHRGDWDLEWWSIYSANTLCLDDYRSGRVFFIGDSAHIVPIFGVRGLNNGMADAYNIGWKLGYVLAGDADPNLLNSYSPERRGATLDVFANATKSTRFMTPPTRGWALVREAALSLAARHEFARKFADPRQMQPYTYRESPITRFVRNDAAFSGGPVSGALAANAKLAEGGFLLDRAGAGFTGIFFDDGILRPEADALFARLRALDPRFTSLLLGASEEVARVYDARPGTFYLLRPDLHVAGRWRRFDADEVAGALRTCLGKAAI